MAGHELTVDELGGRYTGIQFTVLCVWIGLEFSIIKILK